MRTLKPASLGLLHKPYRYRGRHYLAVSALGFFRLGAAADAFLREQDQWPEVMKALPPNEPLDYAMPKGRGEMLLAGSAYAPNGEPVTRMRVRAALGGIDKTLVVVGEREWLYGLMPLYRITPPAPFMQMPIDYTRAYGGPRYRANPVGCGHIGWRPAAFFGDNRGPMPNIETPDAPIRSGNKRYAPAGFGPTDIRTPARQAKAGSYDAKWLAHDFPGLADDVDWTLFNAAPEDQQIDGCFGGGEPYRLEGLHPTKAEIHGVLPAMRVRAFLQRRGQAPAEAEEVPLSFETVWFFPTPEIGVAIYRGRALIDDSDALDVESLLLAYERAADAPRALTHYREALARRVDPATAVFHALNDAPLLPEETAARRTERERRRARDEAEDLARRQTLLDEMTAEFWENARTPPPPGYQPPKAEPSPLPVVTEAAVAAGDVDFVDVFARIDAFADSKRAQAEAKLEEVRKLTPTAPMSRVRVAAQIKDVEQRASVPAHDLLGDSAALDAMARAATTGVDPAALGEKQYARLLDAIKQMPALRRQGRRAAPTATVPAEPLSPEVALHLGRKIRAWHAAGVCLAGRDLAGARLPKMNFAGADLREAMFEQADLRGADFSGANLNGAVLTGAWLDGADFTGADLTGANLCAVRATGATLRQAKLAGASADEACFDGADFSGADWTDVSARQSRFAGARFDEAKFSGASLLAVIADGASFARATFERTALLNARLRDADFSGATLTRVALLNTDAAQSRWIGARLTRMQAGGPTSSFAGAVLRDVIAGECGWRGTDMRGAVLSNGRFARCDFGLCDFDGARLDGALLFRSIFTQAALTRCETDGADFFQALCRKVNLHGTLLTRASVAHADFAESRREARA